MSTNYVDKQTFLEDIAAYQARKLIDPEEPIPTYSATCIMLIAKKLATRPNFSGYSYKDDMVSDGIYVCLKYFDKFDPAKSSNPFGYFTQCIWFAFLQRIAKEKKQTSIKSKVIAQIPFELFDVQDQDVDEGFKNSFSEFLQEHNTDHEQIKNTAKKKKEAEAALILCNEEESEDGDGDNPTLEADQMGIDN